MKRTYLKIFNMSDELRTRLRMFMAQAGYNQLEQSKAIQDLLDEILREKGF